MASRSFQRAWLVAQLPQLFTQHCNNGHTYHLLDTDGTKWWFDAEAEALGLGGHLVTINDAAENQWVLDTFAPVALTYAHNNNLPDQRMIALWIGLSDHLIEGTYQWSSGQPNGYTNWWAGQPQNNSSDEDFAGMLINYRPGEWHDIVGDTRAIDLPFGVVEVEAVPEPLTILGSVTALSIGALLKREYSRKEKK